MNQGIEIISAKNNVRLKNVAIVRDILLITFVAALISAAYLRIYFGLDLTDESFYVSLAYRFVLGDRPILDEYSMYQFASTLTYPFYKLFYLSQNSTDGIILFGRHLYFFFFSLLGAYIYKSLKVYIGWRIALLLASFCLLYVPFNIMGLSYNTVAMLCFTFGAFCSFNYCYQRDSKPKLQLIITGVAYSLAVYVYPTFLLPVLCSVVLLCLHDNYKKVILNLLLGVLPSICLFVFLLFNAKFELYNLISYLQITGYTNKGSAEISRLVSFWLNSVPHFALFGVLILIVTTTRLRTIKFANSILYQRIAQSILIVLPFFLMGCYVFQYIATKQPNVWYNMLINFSFLAPLYLVYAKEAYLRNLFKFIWVPSLVAGFVTSITSVNVFVNFIIGLFPAFIISMLIIYSALRVAVKAVPIFLVVIMAATLCFYKFSYIYRDGTFSSLNYRVDSGPYKHLYTSHQNYQIVTQIDNDLKTIIQNYHARNIIVYPSFSGVYLFSNLKPQTNSVWLVAKCDNMMTLDYFERTEKQPQVAIIFKPYLKFPNDVVLSYFSTDSYSEILDRKLYTIYIASKKL